MVRVEKRQAGKGGGGGGGGADEPRDQALKAKTARRLWGRECLVPGRRSFFFSSSVRW